MLTPEDREAAAQKAARLTELAHERDENARALSTYQPTTTHENAED